MWPVIKITIRFDYKCDQGIVKVAWLKHGTSQESCIVFTTRYIFLWFGTHRPIISLGGTEAILEIWVNE